MTSADNEIEIHESPTFAPWLPTASIHNPRASLHNMLYLVLHLLYSLCRSAPSGSEHSYSTLLYLMSTPYRCLSSKSLTIFLPSLPLSLVRSLPLTLPLTLSLLPSLPLTLPPTFPPSLSPLLRFRMQAGPKASYEGVSHTERSIQHLQHLICYTIAMKKSTALHSAGQYRTGYSTVQYSTVQYSTVQYSTVQYSTIVLAMKSLHLYFLAPLTLFCRNAFSDCLY